MSYDATHRHSDTRTATSLERDGNYATLEIGGVAILALLAMGLLTVGYNMRSASEVQVPPQQSAGAPSTSLGTTPQTQPRAPGNNTPAAPTGSTTGQGPDNGSTGAPTNNATPSQQ